MTRWHLETERVPGAFGTLYVHMAFAVTAQGLAAREVSISLPGKHADTSLDGFLANIARAWSETLAALPLIEVPPGVEPFAVWRLAERFDPARDFAAEIVKVRLYLAEGAKPIAADVQTDRMHASLASCLTDVSLAVTRLLALDGVLYGTKQRRT